MANKTVKELSEDFNGLKTELLEIQSKFNEFEEKHTSVEEKLNNLILKVDQIFKCSECEMGVNTKEHWVQNKCKTKNGLSFQCEECDTCFNAEWKLKKHMKSHQQISCDACDKLLIIRLN